MFGLLAGIVALIAAGGLVAYCVVLTFRWLKDKIKKNLKIRTSRKLLLWIWAKSSLHAPTNVLSVNSKN